MAAMAIITLPLKGSPDFKVLGQSRGHGVEVAVVNEGSTAPGPLSHPDQVGPADGLLPQVHL